MRKLFATLTLVAAFAAPALADAKKDLAALNGTWNPTSMELGGRKTPADQLKAITMTITDGKYNVTVDGQSDKGTLKLDKKDKLKTMDIVGTEGPNKGKTFPAIYELDGDTLKICYALEGDKRPTEFKASERQLLLVTYQRAKK
jgi:uncharacterized protein (TIGR03067 family)